MNAIITYQKQPNTKTFFIFIVSSLLFLLIYNFSDEVKTDEHPVAKEQTESQEQEKEQTEQQNKSGKNGKHANQKAKDSAKQKYENYKNELDKLKRKPNKTKQDKLNLKKLERQVKHWKEKMNFSGENHSQTAKGNK